MINRINGHVKMLGDLNKYIDNLTEVNSRLREQLNNWNKDEEIKKLNNQYRNVVSRSVHIMSDKEETDLKAFRENHYVTCKGNVIEIISHTGIGSAIMVKCTKCNTEKSITDVGNW